MQIHICSLCAENTESATKLSAFPLFTYLLKVVNLSSTQMFFSTNIRFKMMPQSWKYLQFSFIKIEGNKKCMYSVLINDVIFTHFVNLTIGSKMHVSYWFLQMSRWK